MAAYYNENEPYAAAWLRNLIARGRIADGDVDDRDIRDVRPEDLRDYTQCHFFAGIGAWSYALRLAGWPDDLPVWTGSCPCQPFSVAGRRKGAADERHLWPVWHELIGQCAPAVIFGEQVASADGRDWLAAVRSDLEDLDYAVGAADLCAAGAGAPHIRQRLYWLGYANDARSQRRFGSWDGTDELPFGPPSLVGGLEHAARSGWQQRRAESDGRSTAGGRGEISSWTDAEYLSCTDGKYRPAQPGSFPLAHGAPARVGRLRAYGNAIVPQVAAHFVQAFIETCRNPGG